MSPQLAQNSQNICSSAPRRAKRDRRNSESPKTVTQWAGRILESARDYEFILVQPLYYCPLTILQFQCSRWNHSHLAMPRMGFQSPTFYAPQEMKPWSTKTSLPASCRAVLRHHICNCCIGCLTPNLKAELGNENKTMQPVGEANRSAIRGRMFYSSSGNT